MKLVGTFVAFILVLCFVETAQAISNGIGGF